MRHTHTPGPSTVQSVKDAESVVLVKDLFSQWAYQATHCPGGDWVERSQASHGRLNVSELPSIVDTRFPSFN